MNEQKENILVVLVKKSFGLASAESNCCDQEAGPMTGSDPVSSTMQAAQPTGDPANACCDGSGASKKIVDHDAQEASKEIETTCCGTATQEVSASCCNFNAPRPKEERRGCCS